MPRLYATSSILLLHPMALVLYLLQWKESWLHSRGSSSLLWAEGPYLSSLFLEHFTWGLRTSTPEILKMAFTFDFPICPHEQCACVHSGKRLTCDTFLFCSPPYCFTIINLLFDNFIYNYNAFWLCSSPTPLLTSSYFHLLPSSSQVPIPLGKPLGLNHIYHLFEHR